MQQATAEEVYLHSLSTAVISYLAARAPKSPFFCLEINLLDIWLSNFLLFNWQYFGDILHEPLICTTTTNHLLLWEKGVGLSLLLF